MTIRCPACHSENIGDARFCSSCTLPLSHAGAVSAITKTLESPIGTIPAGTVYAGHYEIIGRIGAGGMGEVYLAMDMNLGRHVAIKLLPSSFAEDRDRMVRFDREARLLAALNHPNIAAIYGLEEVAGKRFLVLELVEGQSLQTRLERGPLSVEEALKVCLQLAEGLEAAHEKGIVHRDLKPGNIMMTPEGKVKILDFGLAKASGRDTTAGGFDSEEHPTITAQMTEPGIILGTAPYMSPEQARSRPTDKRTDIWSFGCVLYECLTGKRAFQGDTSSDTLAQVLKGEPEWRNLPADTPQRLRILLGRCLEKDLAERLHDIADARIEMQGNPGSFADPSPPPARRRLRPSLLAGGCVAALALGILVGPTVRGLLGPGGQPPSLPLVRSTVLLEPGHWLGGQDLFDYVNPPRPTRTEIVVSADGRFLVYSAGKADPGPSDRSCLYMRKLDELVARPIAGTDGGHSPFLSPDGDWLGFWADGKLMRVPLGGGISTFLCDILRPFGFSWGSGGQIVFVRDRDSGLMRISADGGKVETLTVPDRSKGEYAHRLPHFLPDGKRVLFTIKRHPWDPRPRLAVLDIASRKWQTLLEDGADGRFVPPGYLVFLRRGTLMAVPFDPDRLETGGQPVPVLPNVSQALNTTQSAYDTAAGQFAISASGDLIYATGGISPDQENSLVWIDSRGRIEPVVASKLPFYSTRLSPDGRRIVYSLLGTERQIWILDLARGIPTSFIPEGMSNWALWTPDSKGLVFDWLKTGVPNIYRQPADGSSQMERLTNSEYIQWPGSLSPDGQILAFIEQHEETRSDIYCLNIRDGQIRPLLSSRFYEAYPEISPDGRWIAYVTDESGRNEVYVQAFPEPKGRWQVSHQSGIEPLWARDGRSLFYRSGETRSQVWAVDIKAGSEFSALKPRFMFDLPRRLYAGGPVRTWDIAPDGRRFLAATLGDSRGQPVTELVFVQNWFEELKRLAPSGRK